MKILCLFGVMTVWATLTLNCSGDERNPEREILSAFEAAKLAVQKADRAALEKSCTANCINSLVADIGLACRLYSESLLDKGFGKYLEFDRKLNDVSEPAFENATVYELARDDWYSVRHLGLSSKQLQGVKSIEDLLKSVSGALQVCDPAVSIRDIDCVVAEEIECVIEAGIFTVMSRAEAAILKVRSSAGLLQIAPLVGSDLFDAKADLAFVYGGAATLFDYCKLIEREGSELEPLVALRGELNDIRFENNKLATAMAVTKERGRTLRWQLVFRRSEFGWKIDSFGYGFSLEPVFGGNFPRREIGRWSLSEVPRDNSENANSTNKK